MLSLLRRTGHRGSVLAGFCGVCLAYGTGLLLGYRPTFAVALGVPVIAFGWAFIGLGLFALTGSPRRHDSLQYAVSVLGVTAWALVISTHWTQPYGWTAAVSWDGIALGLLLASAWPNAPRTVHAASLPSLESLVARGDGGDGVAAE